MMTHKKLIFFITIICLSGCSDDSVEPNYTNYPEMFNSFYKTFDRNYSYFEYKNINWAAEKMRYEADINNVHTDSELIDLLLEMVKPMRDVHVWFRSDNDYRASYRSNKFMNWDKTVWEEYVTSNNWQQQQSYWGYATFNETPYFAFEAWKSDHINVSDFDAALENFKESDTIVIDVRMNPGGSDNLALDIAGRFTAQTLTVTYYKFRDGPLHSDFTELFERKISPRGTWQFTNPVYVLIGSGCFSSNETFISAMRELPHVTLIGDTTGGSSGNPKLFNLGNGWEYSVPRWINYTADMQVIEWNGIAPDIYIETTEEDFLDGRDPVLDFVMNHK